MVRNQMMWYRLIFLSCLIQIPIMTTSVTEELSDLQIAEQVETPKESQEGVKTQQTKNYNTPKRALSAFFWFTLDERPKLLKENPTISAIEEAKAMSRMWTAASPETKAKYEAIAEEDRARYDREVAAYEAGGSEVVP